MTLRDSSYVAILDFITPVFWESVVSHVLNHRDQLPSDIRRKFDAEINKAVKIPQFPNQPAKAPASFLKQPIIDRLLSSESLVNAVLQSWFVSQETLYALVVSRLHTREFDVDYPDFVGNQLKGSWPYEDWMAEQDDILALHGDLNRDDVALMLCFATGKTPRRGGGISEDQSHQMPRDILEQARRYLVHLPASAPEWSIEIADFLTFLTQLVDAKRVENEVATLREALNSQISKLREEYSGDLVYLELDVSSWAVSPGLISADMSKAHCLLTEFGRLLAGYERSPVVGSSVSETRAWWEEHNDLALSIQNIKADLDNILAPDGGQPDERFESGFDPCAHTEQLEASGDAALAAIGLSDGSLNFSPATTDYFMEIDNSVDRLVISPSVTHEGAKIDVTTKTAGDGSIHALESDRGVFVVAGLNVGETVIAINVTLDDPNVSNTYTLTVVRAPSIDATLADIRLSEGDVDFDYSVTDYQADVSNSVDSISIVPITTHPRSNIQVNVNGEAGDTTEIVPSISGEYRISPLPLGEMVITLVVTAEDLRTKRAYTVTITRAACSDESPVAGQGPTAQMTQDNVNSIETGAIFEAEDEEATETINEVDTTTADVSDLTAGLWSLVANDDLAGAYFVARSMAAQGFDPPIPSSLLKAVQGARWLSPGSTRYVYDLFEIDAEIERSEDSYVHVLLGLAASLLPSIVAPETNLLGWLPESNRVHEFDRIVSPIRTFGNNGRPLLPEYISGDEGNQNLHDQIKQASADAARWLDESRQFHQTFARADNVFRSITREDGFLYQMLAPVSDDNRSEIETVRGHVDNLSKDAYLDEIVDEADRYSSSSKRRIVGDAKNWLVRRILEARDLATNWCALVSRENDRQRRDPGSRMLEQVSTLRSQLEAECPAALDALSEMASDANHPDIAASALCATRSLLQLADYLKLRIQRDLHLEPSPIVHDLKAINDSIGSAWIQRIEIADLEAVVSRRLLWVPTIPLDDSGSLPNEDSIVNREKDIIDSSGTLVENAIRCRMDLRDFRFFCVLGVGLPADKLAPIKERYFEDLRVERKTLEEAMQSTWDAIDQATKDGVIEFEGALWDEYVHSLDDVIVEEVLQFEPVHDVLDRIKGRLAANTAERRDELISDWEALASVSAGSADFDTGLFDRLRSTFEKANCSESLDVRVMEDCVSRLRDYCSGEENPVPLGIQESSREQSLEEFLAFCREIRQDPDISLRRQNALDRFRQELADGV